MTAAQRNLAKARKVRAEKADKIRRQRQREHKAAQRTYDQAREGYRHVRAIHEEGTPQEKKAFRKLIRAEAEWFRTYPAAT